MKFKYKLNNKKFTQVYPMPSENFLEKFGNPYNTIAFDNNGKQSINFGVYGIPESILVDKELIIIKKFIGPISKSDYEFIKKKIENLWK